MKKFVTLVDIQCYPFGIPAGTEVTLVEQSTPTMALVTDGKTRAYVLMHELEEVAA